MERIVVFLFVAMVLGINTVSAEIRKTPDNFSGGVILRSNYLTIEDPIKAVGFDKIITPDSIEYELCIAEKMQRKFMFEDSIVEIKINNSDTYRITIKEADPFPFNNLVLGINDLDPSGFKATIPDEVINEIETAEHVSFRLRDRSGMPFVFILPDKVLAEWQQVIATEQ